MIILLLLGSFCLASPLTACFGPKLYLGTGEGAEADVLYALVTLYVKEKTGVESVRVVLPDNQNPVAEIDAQRVDLAFVTGGSDARATLLLLDGYPALITGPRPVNDLQFTTVVPAIRKLAALLRPEDVTVLARQVRDGGSPLATVRAFFMERRWI